MKLVLLKRNLYICRWYRQMELEPLAMIISTRCYSFFLNKKNGPYF